MAVHLELKNNTLYIDGFQTTENNFTQLIQEAWHHHIVFQNTEELTFTVKKISDDFVVILPAVAPVGFKYFYFYMKEMLKNKGPIAILYQDTYWLDRR